MKLLEMTDFIGVYTDVFPEGYCQHVISDFERLRGSGIVDNRQNVGEGPRHTRDDEFVGLNISHSSTSLFEGGYVPDIFFAGLQSCCDHYKGVFSSLDTVSLQANHMKMQKVNPGCGYHIWHHEKTCVQEIDRVVVYMLYLNTLEEEGAGETEFLYQQKRVRPTENTMVIWPSEYTHPHRGNVVHGDKAKYIITGWFYLV